MTGEQRRLVDGLSRAALQGAGIADPSAAQRDDITGTLQAAIADPDVAARIGRLTKAERWSGFGEFGDSTTVFATPQASGGTESPVQDDAAERALREQRARARAVLTAAEVAKSEADDALADRQGELAAARLRLDDARQRLAEAEAAVASAEEAHHEAEQASRAAMAEVKTARAQLAGPVATPGN